MGYLCASGFALERNTCSFSARPRCDTTTWPSCRKRPASDTASVTRPPRFSRRSRIRPWIFDSSSLSNPASTSRATFCASKLVTLRKAMPGLYQKASTRLVSIPPRITVTVIGSGAPSRVTVTRTGVPSPPRNTSATPAESFLVTSLPSTATITSPRRRSARHAGEPGNGSMAITLGPSVEISMPMPKYCARCLRCMSAYFDAEILRALLALHVRVFGGVEEVGVRIERAQHARNRTLVDGFLRGDRIGVILLQQRENRGDRLETLVEIVLRGGSARPDAGAVKWRQHGADTDNQRHLNRSPNFHELPPGGKLLPLVSIIYRSNRAFHATPPGARTGTADLTSVDSSNSRNGCKFCGGAGRGSDRRRGVSERIARPTSAIQSVR